MVNCPSCGAPIYLHLENCPYCGCAIPKEEKIIEQHNEPQMIVQQVVQEDPYAKQREHERIEAKYRKKQRREICRIIAGCGWLLVSFPFYTSGGSWPFYLSIIGGFAIGIGIKKYNKLQQEYEKNKIE